jgi:arylsulfatase A-like enzyme
VFFVTREGEFLVDRNPLYAFMHGSPWEYDTHVPLLFHGAPYINRGVWNDPVTQQDVVPTLAALLGTAPPATATGRPLRQALATATARPRVVALFVLDGMRADYFDTYAAVLPNLTRLRNEGAWFSRAHITSIPTLTAVGHANLGTGTEPRIHGLAVNNLFNRVTGKAQEAYNELDPGEMMALTLADVWNIETEGRAVIIGQGGRDSRRGGSGRTRRVSLERTSRPGRELQHPRCRVGDESGVLCDVSGVGADQRAQLLGSGTGSVAGT